MPRLTTQAEVSNPKRKGYDFRIDNQLYRAAVGPGRQMEIQSSDVADASVNVRQNPEDFTSNIGRVFSRNNFSGGSNLDEAHRRNGTEKDTIRFWDSQGIDVFNNDLGSSYNIQLLNSTTNARSLSSSDGDNYVAVVGTTIYVSDDATLYKSTDGGTTFATQSTGLTAGYHIKGLAAHGDLLYIVANNGSAGEIETLTSDGTSTQKSTAQTFDGIWAVKNKFLVSAGTSIFEYDGATTVSSAKIVLASGDTWTDVADAGAVVFATATDGRIYAFKDVSSSFTLKGQTEITNEIPTCIAESNGIVFYGTKEDQTGSKKIGRLYRADIRVADDLYVLGNNQLIKEWDIDSIDASPHKLYATRDSVYVGIKESASTSFLWRYYLPTAGIARYYKAAAGGIIEGICKVNENFLFAVTGSGLYLQSSDFETNGFLITPPADFFTAESKQFVGAEIETEELGSGESVDVFISNKFESINDSSDSTWQLELSQQSGTGGEEVQLQRVARYVTAKIELNGNGTSTPKFKSLQIRALARPELVVVQIPVNISDRVERPYRKPIRVKNLGETIYQSLKQKEGDAVTLELFDPAEIIRGVVEKISYPIISNPNIGSVTQYAILTVRGTRQQTFSQVTSGDILGVNGFAIMRFG